jgi:hypothetical protein
MFFKLKKQITAEARAVSNITSCRSRASKGLLESQIDVLDSLYISSVITISSSLTTRLNLSDLSKSAILQMESIKPGAMKVQNQQGCGNCFSPRFGERLDRGGGANGAKQPWLDLKLSASQPERHE